MPVFYITTPNLLQLYQANHKASLWHVTTNQWRPHQGPTKSVHPQHWGVTGWPCQVKSTPKPLVLWSHVLNTIKGPKVLTLTSNMGCNYTTSPPFSFLFFCFCLKLKMWVSLGNYFHLACKRTNKTLSNLNRCGCSRSNHKVWSSDHYAKTWDHYPFKFLKKLPCSFEPFHPDFH